MIQGARIRNGLIVIAVLVALFAAFGYLVAPGLVLHTAEKQLSTLLGRNTSIGSVAVQPFHLGVTIKDFRIARAEGSQAMVAIDQIDAGVSLSSLFRLAPVVNHLRVVRPKIEITRIGPWRFDFSDILDRLSTGPKSDKKVEFSINNIEITGGRVTFHDDVTHSQHELEDITLSLPFISNIRSDVELYVEPAFSAKIDGSLLNLKGKTKPFTESQETTLDLHLVALDLPAYVGFSPIELRPKLASGLLSTDLSIGFARDAAGAPQVRLSGEATLEKLRVLKPDGGEAVSAARIGVALKSVDLLSGNTDLDRVEIEQPGVSLAREANGQFDLAQLFLPAAAASAPHPIPADPPAGPVTAPPKPAAAGGTSRALGAEPGFHLAHLKLTQGTVHYADASLAKPFATVLSDINVSAAEVSDRTNLPATFQISFDTQPSQSVGFEGQASLPERHLQGHLVLKDLQLAPFAPLLAGVTSAKLEDGALGGAADVDLVWTDPGPAIKLQGLSLALDHLRVARVQDREPVIAIDRVLVADTAQFSGDAVQIDKLVIAGLAADIVRDKQGDLNVVELIAPPSHEARVTQESKATRLGGEAERQPAAHEGAFSFSMGSLEVQNSKVAFTDHSLETAASVMLDKLSFSARDLHLTPGARIPFELAARANQKGSLEIKGDLVAKPLALNAEITTRTFPIAPLQGYVGDRLNIKIPNADLTMKAAVKLATAPMTDVRFTGNVEIADFSSLDKVTSAEFLRWKSLRVPKIDAHLAGANAAPTVDIGDVVLSDFYSRLIVYPNGRLNVQNIASEPGTAGPQSITSASAQPTPSPDAKTGSPAGSPPGPSKQTAPRASGGASLASAAPRIRMASMTLSSGEINFTDNFVIPNYTTNITDLNGSVSAVASDNRQPADVNLKGSLEGNGDLAISGKINPLAHPLFLDIAANATNIELTRLTTYAVKYAGYNIEKGKLSLQVKYHIENNKLDAQNSLFLDQLTFGEHVESPTATKLPVLLAVSLLKDTHGQIRVDLPVSGSLSDPEFSIGGVIVRVLINLLEKALVSPFQLLASIGGGDAGELGYVEFDPGQASITPQALAKIDKLADVLASRPALKLDITGRADRATDTEGAKQARLIAKVRGRKYQETIGSTDASFDNVIVTPAEFPKYLEEVYKDSDFEKPKNLVGLTKSLPPDEMQKMIRANMPVNDADLINLADRRAAAVRDALEKSGKIPADRLFIVASKLMTEPPKDKGRPDRVDFSLH